MNRLVVVGALAFVVGTAGGTWMSPARTATHEAAADSTDAPHEADSAVATHEPAAEDHESPGAATEAPASEALPDSSAALAEAIDGLPAETAVALLDRLPEEEVLAVLRRLELTRAVGLIEKMPAERGARLTRQLLLGGR